MTQAEVQLTDNGLYAPLSGGETYFNYHWLRDADPTTIDPQTRERVFDVTSLEAAPSARRACIADDTLEIDWANEDHVTRLPLDRLEAFVANGRKPDPADLPRRLWYAGHDAQFRRISQAEVEGTDAGRARLARALIEEGVALVTDMEDSDHSLTRLVNCLGPVTPTGEGHYFEVRLEIAPTNLAFTAGPLEMHTDLPGEEMAPGVQFLHCRVNTVEGGYSLFLDGAAVASALREEDPEAFELLSTHKIPFFYRHDGWDYRAWQKVIELDARGNVSGVTISQHLQEDMDLPQEVLDAYYPAFCKFIRMMQDPRFVCRFRLNAGDCIVFDNHRVVHGREGFSAESGARHLRGCYTDRGAAWSTYRTLAVKGHDGQPVATAAE
ncbi:TauD/TfdA family dioxygenase [Roseovarius sp.]|uniref:TauD/TfdA family dioxygenase n=1 Tax=Roseovarius sp. TaxID=1486281 RepID=UPI003BAC64CD